MIDDDLEARLHARTAQWLNDQRVHFQRQADQHKAAHEQWVKDREGKLSSLHPAIRSEIEAMAWLRISGGRDANLTQMDIKAAEGRVVSRLRIKQYGAMPKEGEEALRQHNEIRASLGLLPIGHREAA